jgi:hypothetical protein
MRLPVFRKHDALQAFETAVIKKIAWRILPLILVAYCIAYLDCRGGADDEQGTRLQHLHIRLRGRRILPWLLHL